MSPTKKPNQPIKGCRLTQDVLNKLYTLHENWVKRHTNGRRLMLEDCDLQGLNISLYNLTDAILIRCNLTKVYGRGVKFKQATLRGSKFDGADLTNSDFAFADLRSVSFLDADLENAVMNNAELRMDFNNIQEIATSFKGANLSGANLAEAKAKNADFSGAIMRKTDMRATDARGANFQHAEMIELDIAGANMVDTNLTGAILGDEMMGKLDTLRLTIPEFRKLTKVQIAQIIKEHGQWVDSLGREGVRADFAKADLTKVNLSAKNLAVADFSGAKLYGTSLAKSKLLAAVFREASILSVDLSMADCRGADFSQSRQRDMKTDGVLIGAIPGLSLETRGLKAA